MKRVEVHFIFLGPRSKRPNSDLKYELFGSKGKSINPREIAYGSDVAGF